MIPIIILAAAIYIATLYLNGEEFVTPIGKGKIGSEKKLLKYTYTALKKTEYQGSEMQIDKILKDESDFTSYLFYFFVRGKKISGLINAPKREGDYPLIIMVRGYVDRETYSTGTGTSHGGEVLAQNGFITMAPDFLGYGYSDDPSEDALEDRFLTYVTVMELIASSKNLNGSLKSNSSPARFDGEHIGLWGHSNGGQIALSVLEILGRNHPTVLWAPVSKPFPYSILYYTDDIPDHGKALRKVVADFEKDYDSEKYSLTNYFDWVKAPLQIHQGDADESVPVTWSDQLVEALKSKGIDTEYFIYPGESHNFDQGNWNEIMQRTINFYDKQFK